MHREGYCSDAVCLSWLQLTLWWFFHPENDMTNSAWNENEERCGFCCLKLLSCRDLLVLRTANNQPFLCGIWPCTLGLTTMWQFWHKIFGWWKLPMSAPTLTPSDCISMTKSLVAVSDTRLESHSIVHLTRHGRPAALNVHIISPLQQQLVSEATSTPGHTLDIVVQRKLTRFTSHLSQCCV